MAVPELAISSSALRFAEDFSWNVFEPVSQRRMIGGRHGERHTQEGVGSAKFRDY